MDKKISELVELDVLKGDEYIAVQQATDNYKVKLSKMNPIGVRNPNGSTSINNTNNKAVGADSFAANMNNEAKGAFSTTFGESNTTSEDAIGSFVCGENNVTSNVAEFACGRWNQSHTGGTEKEKTLYSIGFGEGGVKANALEVMGDGSAYLIGVGGYNGGNPNAEGVKTLQDVVNNTFDASELYVAARANGKVTPEFRAKLEDALALKKIFYVIDGNTLIMITVADKDSNGNAIFITSNGSTKYQIVLDGTNTATMSVGIVGDPSRRFIADEGRSLLDLNESSDIDSIRTALITDKEEVMLPEVGDSIIVKNTEGIADSGIIISKTSTSSSINYIVRANNLVDKLSVEFHIKFAYNDNVGIDSLKVTYVQKVTIDTTIISEEAMTALNGKVDATRAEQSLYHISKINAAQYASLQEAISALNTYLGDSPKYMGIMITYVDKQNKVNIYVYDGGSFVSERSWTRLYPFSIFN